MSRFEQKLKSHIGKDAGFRLPEGSLERLYADTLSKLPEREPAKPLKFSAWQKVKPYIYMAAMFAGIWCTMKIFHTVSTSEVSLDNPPAMIADAMVDLHGSDYSETLGDYEIEEEVIDSYSDIEDFEKDFGFTLSPQYAGLNVAE